MQISTVKKYSINDGAPKAESRQRLLFALWFYRSKIKVTLSNVTNVIVRNSSEALKRASVENKGLTGEFNATIAKLMLSNHGYSDKQQVKQINNVRLDFNKSLSALFEE